MTTPTATALQPSAPASRLFTLAPGLSLFLASTSPRRKELLSATGLLFSSLNAGGSEPEPEPSENPRAFTLRAASAKGRAALDAIRSRKMEKYVILAADTVVYGDGEIMGKPKSCREAFAMLRKLAGKTHHVISCVYLAWEKNGLVLEESFAEDSAVTFYPWPDEVLKAYACSEEPRDKAGAYAIQGAGAFLASSIQGSWTNVVGLPVSSLLKTMLCLNLIIPC